MSALEAELVRRYPLLRDIRLAVSSAGQREAVPAFFGLLLALAESDDERGCCVVVPDPTGVAHVFATLLSMVRLRREFDLLTRAWADQGFEPGQSVRVLPSGHVFVYEGVYDHKPNLFQLREPDSTSTLSLPVSEVLRLEPTTRKRPKGKVSGEVLSVLRQKALPPLDMLLGIESWGNDSLFRNRVLLLSSHSAFDRFLGDTTVCSAADRGLEVSGTLTEVLPWGTLDDSGALQHGDAYQVRGEPIVAVTHDVDVLAEACAESSRREEGGDPLGGFSTGPSVVVSEGTSRLLRNLRAVDEIESDRKVIVVAGPDEREGLDLLADRGFGVWWATPDEMRLERVAGPGASDHDDPKDGALFGGFARAAENQRSFQLAAALCEDEHLDLAASALVLAVDALEGTEGEEMLGTVRSLFGPLFRASERLSPFADEERAEVVARLDEVRDRVGRRAQWLSQDAVEMVEEAIGSLERAALSSTLGSSKADAVDGLLVSGPTEGWGPTAPREAVLVRYGGSRAHVEACIRASGCCAPVYSVRHVPAEWKPDHIVMLCWPGAARFRSLVGGYPSPRVSVLVYPFERDWLQQFRRRMDRQAAEALLPVAVRSSLFGLPAALLPDGSPSPPEDSDKRDADALDVFRIEEGVLRRRKGSHARVDNEETVEAHYVGFVGDTFAWMTEGASLPVVTSVVHGAVDGVGPKARSIPRRPVSELKPGDFVLFREGSDHDVTRVFAEQIAGPQTYRDLRRLATAWRPPLRALSPDASQVYRMLRDAGLTRRFVTVQKWLTDEDQIGPQDREDLDVIARVAGLPSRYVEEIWGAIHEVRRYHAKAGHRITEWLLKAVPQHADRLRDGEARLDLAFGTTYVVEIEEIDPEQIEAPARLVNELQWDTSG